MDARHRQDVDGEVGGTRGRVLVVDYAGHPFQYDLSAEFGARGYAVLHTYSASTPTPQTDFACSVNVTVRPVDLGHPFERYKLFPRIRDELLYGWKTVRLARRFGPNRVITSNVPVLSLLVVWVWLAASRTRWTLWLQDVQSGLVHLAGKAGVVARALRMIEFFLIRRAANVVVISDGVRDELAKAGIDRRHMTVIENWAPLDSIPERPRQNAWSAEHGLDDKFVFLYSGTLGLKHSPELLNALAEEFDGDDRVAVVAVGEGPGADWLGKQGGPQPTRLPFQPFERLPDVLGTADVLLVLLNPAAGAFSVPSKALSYLCAGRAVLGAIPPENAAATMIGDRAEAGVVTPPADVCTFRKAARELMEDQRALGRFGRNAREFATTNFDRRPIADRFLHALDLEPERR